MGNPLHPSVSRLANAWRVFRLSLDEAAWNGVKVRLVQKYINAPAHVTVDEDLTAKRLKLRIVTEDRDFEI